MPATYHFAYSGIDDQGISQDASLLIDEDEEGVIDAPLLTAKLTAFLRACGWERPLLTIK